MNSSFWWRSARTPLAIFVVLASVCATTTIDVDVARALFFDSFHGRWIGAGNWWIESVLHTGGRWAIRGLVLIGITCWVAATFDRSLRVLRRPSAYFVVAVVLAVGAVGLLKALTNVSCPWDLRIFGGRYPLVPLFAHRTATLRDGHCFPAAHASAGYALLALYFVFRERSAALARAGLTAGIVTGVVFGLAQQTRGAHFVSHDLWSAFVCWIVVLTTYTCMFKARLWDRPERSLAREQTSLRDQERSAAIGIAAPRAADERAGGG